MSNQNGYYKQSIYGPELYSYNGKLHIKGYQEYYISKMISMIPRIFKLVLLTSPYWLYHYDRLVRPYLGFQIVGLFLLVILYHMLKVLRGKIRFDDPRYIYFLDAMNRFKKVAATGKITNLDQYRRHPQLRHLLKFDFDLKSWPIYYYPKATFLAKLTRSKATDLNSEINFDGINTQEQPSNIFSTANEHRTTNQEQSLLSESIISQPIHVIADMQKNWTIKNALIFLLARFIAKPILYPGSTYFINKIFNGIFIRLRSDHFKKGAIRHAIKPKINNLIIDTYFYENRHDSSSQTQDSNLISDGEQSSVIPADVNDTVSKDNNISNMDADSSIAKLNDEPVVVADGSLNETNDANNSSSNRSSCNRNDSKLFDSTEEMNKYGQYLVITNEGNCSFYENGVFESVSCATKFSVLGWNHAGFSKSYGIPYHFNEQISMLSVIDYAINFLGFKIENIVLLGWSIGGFPTITGSNYFPNIKMMILDATFYSVEALALSRAPFLKPIIPTVFKQYFNLSNLELLKKYDGPVKIILRSLDTVMMEDVSNPLTNSTLYLSLGILKHRYPKIFTDENISIINKNLLYVITSRIHLSFLIRQKFGISKNQITRYLMDNLKPSESAHFPNNFEPTDQTVGLTLCHTLFYFYVTVMHIDHAEPIDWVQLYEIVDQSNYCY